MINIVLSCSQQAWNKCLLCKSEQDHTFSICLKVAERLKSYNANVCVLPKITGDEGYTLNEVVRLSNDFIRQNGNTGFHLDVHTDGGYNSSGASGYYMSEAGKAFIIPIWRKLTQITPYVDGIVNLRTLKVLRDTVATAGLIEVSFHDKLDEATWIHNNQDKIADAIVEGLVQGTGIVKNQEIVDEQLKSDLEILASYTNSDGTPLLNKEYWTINTKEGSQPNPLYVAKLIKNLARKIIC
jgi:hypothetical protein